MSDEVKLLPCVDGFFYVEWIGEPCPWCASLGVSGKSPEGHFFAGCPDADCLAHNLAYDFVTVDHARAAWNTRASEATRPPIGTDEVVANVTRAICTVNDGNGYCGCVGEELGCMVGRGEPPEVSRCKMTDEALMLTGEYRMALAAIAAMKDAASD